MKKIDSAVKDNKYGQQKEVTDKLEKNQLAGNDLDTWHR